MKKLLLIIVGLLVIGMVDAAVVDYLSNEAEAKIKIYSLTESDDDNDEEVTSTETYNKKYTERTNKSDDDDTVINENKVLEKNTIKGEEVISGSNTNTSFNFTSNKTDPSSPNESKLAAVLPDAKLGTFFMIGSIIFIVLGGVGLFMYKLLFNAPDDSGFDEEDVEDIIYDMEVEDANSKPLKQKKEEDVDDILEHLDD